MGYKHKGGNTMSNKKRFELLSEGGRSLVTVFAVNYEAALHYLQGHISVGRKYTIVIDNKITTTTRGV
jgi:hypothetical protein